MKASERSGTVWVRLSLCIAILAVGIGGFVVFQKMKTPPVQTTSAERPIVVEATRVEHVNIPVRVSGFGQVSARTVVPLSAEVAGKVTSVHPRLDEGEIIRNGELLVTIDERDYRLEYETAKSRLKTLQRDHELALKEFTRLQALYEQNKVGSLSSVEKAESAMNSIIDRISQVEQSMLLASLRLERSVISAPFTSRITEVMIEENEYVTPGKKLVTIVDDSDLEIIVSLDSRDVLNWLQLSSEEIQENSNWFKRLESAECRIVWTEDDRVRANGKVDRVVRFDPKTRTVLVAVRVVPDPETLFPMVDGMFSKVAISGRTLESVFVLPRQAVSFENKVYVSVKDRLQTRPVKVVRLEKGRAIISDGLVPGEIVVTTRLEQPLENTLLSVIMVENKEQ